MKTRLALLVCEATISQHEVLNFVAHLALGQVSAAEAEEKEPFLKSRGNSTSGAEPDTRPRRCRPSFPLFLLLSLASGVAEAISQNQFSQSTWTLQRPGLLSLPLPFLAHRKSFSPTSARLIQVARGCPQTHASTSRQTQLVVNKQAHYREFGSYLWRMLFLRAELMPRALQPN